jgi:anti-sigma B factor antagonist
LNLDDVSYIDSSGLGEPVGAYATGANQGAQIKLRNVQKRVHDFFTGKEALHGVRVVYE